MQIKLRQVCCLIVTFISGLTMAAQSASADAPNASFKVRTGYKVSLVTNNLKEARFLETDGQGTIFVAQPSEGKVVFLRDSNGNGRFEEKGEFVSGYKT